MGAKINEVIESVEVENDFSAGSHVFKSVSVDFSSVSDVLIIRQGENTIAMELTQLDKFLKIMTELNDKI